ncbi:TraI domain-containing protein, partial [Xanthomonas arboricola]|uniref:TraI domain-containing protein n=1 Tax=Xanthomonas arboricola TaxID=56448 RepID=UPI003D18B061
MSVYGTLSVSLFQRKAAILPPIAAVTENALGKGLLHPKPAAELLTTPRRQKLLEHIWQRTSLSRKQFHTLYRVPIERYADLVQQFPASVSTPRKIDPSITRGLR